MSGAFTVRTHGVKLVNPTPEVYESLAESLFISAVNAHGGAPTAWDALPDPIRDIWRQIAHDAYGQIAMLSGATVSDIPIPKD